MKFIKGVSFIGSTSQFKFLLQVNEAGSPINFTFGIYREKSWGKFFYLYLFGKRWSKNW